jgi:hypothetical protein
MSGLLSVKKNIKLALAARIASLQERNGGKESYKHLYDIISIPDQNHH